MYKAIYRQYRFAKYLKLATMANFIVMCFVHDSILEYLGLQSWQVVKGPDRSSLSKALFSNVIFDINFNKIIFINIRKKGVYPSPSPYLYPKDKGPPVRCCLLNSVPCNKFPSFGFSGRGTAVTFEMSHMARVAVQDLQGFYISQMRLSN